MVPIFSYLILFKTKEAYKFSLYSIDFSVSPVKNGHKTIDPYSNMEQTSAQYRVLQY